jgi:hypothetical protein
MIPDGVGEFDELVIWLCDCEETATVNNDIEGMSDVFWKQVQSLHGRRFVPNLTAAMGLALLQMPSSCHEINACERTARS